MQIDWSKFYWCFSNTFDGKQPNSWAPRWTFEVSLGLKEASSLCWAHRIWWRWCRAAGWKLVAEKVIGWCVLVHRTRWLCCKLFYMNSNQDPIVIALSLAHLAVSNSITHCPVFWSHRNARFQYCMFQVWNAIAIHCYFHLPILGGLNASSWCARNLLGQLQVWARPSLKSSWEMKWTTQMTTLGVICGM